MCSEKPANDNPYTSAVPLLSNGVLDLYEPSLKEVKQRLTELNAKQEAVHVQLHKENKELTQAFQSKELDEIFKKMSGCHTKLVNIKKDMKYLYEKSTQLKRRALRLQQVKEEQQKANERPQTSNK